MNTTDTGTGAIATTQIENEHFRVTEWRIKPGGHIPMHVHEYEYVVVPQMTGKMHVENADGSEIVAELVPGNSYTRSAGSEHRIENRYLDSDVVFIEIERL